MRLKQVAIAAHKVRRFLRITTFYIPFCIVACLSPSPLLGQGVSEFCIFTESSGAVRQVNGRSAVPETYRDSARCFQGSSTVAKEAEKVPQRSGPFNPLEKPTGMPSVGRGGTGVPSSVQLAAPSEVDLEGSIRRVSMNSALGPIELRWPRSVERLFGRTPERAMADAALTASKALKRKAFPPRVKNLRLNWQVVFFDGDLPAGQIPEYLRTTCHPGWMTPPANIYVVASRVTGQCSGRATASVVADSELAQLLVHEIGHAVEYYLLARPLPPEGVRAEGFATWFESFAADQSSLIQRGVVAQTHRRQAIEAMQQRPGSWTFGYSGQDYSRASMYFHGIEARFGLPAMMRVYELVAARRMPFIEALSRELKLKPSEIEQIAVRAATSG